jgi:hypothetical protein
MPSCRVSFSLINPRHTGGPKRWYVWYRAYRGWRKMRIETYVRRATKEGRTEHARNVILKAKDRGYAPTE